MWKQLLDKETWAMEKEKENIDSYDDLLNFLDTKCKLGSYFIFLLLSHCSCVPTFYAINAFLC